MPFNQNWDTYAGAGVTVLVMTVVESGKNEEQSDFAVIRYSALLPIRALRQLSSLQTPRLIADAAASPTKAKRHVDFIAAERV